MSRLGTGRLMVMGATMLRLMTKRGIVTWKALSSRIRMRTGNAYSPARISNWAYGRHPPALPFCHDFAVSVGLSQAERKEWDRAFLRGYDVPAEDADLEEIPEGLREAG